MAPQNELNRLQTAWRALDGEIKGEGWRTIPIEPNGPRQLLAGRHFPGNEEAVLVGFNAVRVPHASQLPQGRGFRVERVEHEMAGEAHLWISLSRQPAGGLDMFARMAEDIVDMLAAYGNMDDQTLFQLFLGRIKAWQEFMYEGRAEVLGPEAEIGLAGELCFLRLLLERGVPDMAVLDGWQGPLNGLHDFRVGYGAIEVKSTVAKQGFPAIVASLEQLDASLVSPLFLAGIRFVLDDSGATLSDIVRDLSFRLENHPETKGKFESLVLRAGFLWAFSDRYTRRLSHSDTRIIPINPEFPALTRNNVNPAIRSVRYELDLDLVSVPDIGLARTLEALGVLT